MTDIKRVSRPHAMVLRLDEAEQRKLDAIAAAWGTTRSAAVRRLVREARLPHVPPAPQDHS